MKTGKPVQIYMTNENRELLARLAPRSRSILINELITAFFAPSTFKRNMAAFRALLIAAEFEIETKGNDNEKE